MGSNTKKTFEPDPSLYKYVPRLVVYELQMFLDSLHALRVDLSILHPRLSWLFNNARLEVTLVHGRILFDFFERSSADRNDKGDDDILSWHMGFPTKPVPGSKSLRNAINKRATHLTFTRASFQDPRKKSWSPELFDPLVERCCEFLCADSPNEFVEEHASQDTRETWDRLKESVACVKT